MLSTTALPALGADVTWSGATNSDWAEATNWIGGVAPGAADTAIVDIAVGPTVDGVTPAPVSTIRIGNSSSGTLTVQNGGELRSTSHTYFGSLATGSGTVTVSDIGSELASGNNLYIGSLGSGALTIGNGAVVSSVANTYLGISATGSGTALVTGAGSQIDSGDALLVGGSGSGSLTVEGGGSATSTGTVSIGNSAGSTGVITIDGADSELVSGNVLYVGQAGTGTLTMEDGATATSTSHIYFGYGASGSGTGIVRGAGSSLESGSTLIVGLTGSGTLTIEDGATASSTSHVYVGSGATGSGIATVTGASSELVSGNQLRIANSGTATLNILNGGSVSNVGVGYIGTNADSTGEVTISGAGSTWGNSLQLYVGNAGTGTITVSDGGEVNAASSVVFGNAAAGVGTGTVSGSGSQLTSGSTLSVANNGTATLTIEDGGSVTSASHQFIGGGAGSDGTINVTGAGSRLDSNGQLQIGNFGTGSLTVEDGGSVLASSVVHVGVNSGSTGTLTVANGGNATSGSYSSIGTAANTTGSATITGAGSQMNGGSQLIVGNSGNGTLTLSDGGVAQTTGSVTLASSSGSTGTLNIGAADGDAAGAAGTVDADSVTFGAGTGTIVFNHTDMNYAFAPDLIGNGALNFLAGYTILSGDNSGFTGTMAGSADVNVADGELSVASDSSGFSGTTTVANANLRVNGQLGGDTIIGNGGTLYGTGALGDVTFNNGSSAAPGNSIGTTNVVNVVFNPGSVFDVELNAAGQSDRIAATGTATINGGSVTIVPFPDYAVATPYTILTAAGGVSGTFDSVTGTGFVTGQLAYDPNTVFLTLSADASALAAAARTPNQQAVAQSTASATGNDAVNALAFLPDDASARQALDALSGEMHASLSSTQIMEQNRLRQIALERSPHVATTLGDGTIWAVGSHTRGQIDGDGNAASIEGRNSGVMVGIETQLDDAHIGLAIGQSASDLDVDDRNSWAQSTNYHFMAYGGTALGDSGISLDGGASWTWHEVETDRAIAYSGFNDRSEADYNAQTGQVFASLNQTFHIDDTDLRPHIDGAFIHSRTDAFREDGEAGLEAGEQSRNVGVTTLGIDAAHTFSVEEDKALTLSGGVGWQHVIGDADSDRRVAFRDAPATARTVKGVSLARDALSVNSAIEYTVGDSVNFSLSYDALLAADSSQHGIGGQIGIRF